MIESFSYKGKVCITLTVNGRRREIRAHNNGTPTLFIFLARCLVGDFDAKSAPLLLSAANDSGITMGTPAPLTASKYVSYKDGDDVTHYVARFTATLYGNDINSSSPYLALLDGSNNILAKIKVVVDGEEKDVKDVITEGVQGLVEWDMEITNVI